MKSYFKPDREHYKKNSAKWKNRREECFLRDFGRCQYCNRPKSEYMEGIHPHHRIFKSQSGDDSLNNLATACYICHGDHGSLKNKKLITEKDNLEINRLIAYYRNVG